jgi:glycyl-tRNA synthetase
VPHVIESAGGVGRTVLALLCDAYDEDELGGESRSMRFVNEPQHPAGVASP